MLKWVHEVICKGLEQLLVVGLQRVVDHIKGGGEVLLSGYVSGQSREVTGLVVY